MSSTVKVILIVVAVIIGLGLAIKIVSALVGMLLGLLIPLAILGGIGLLIYSLISRNNTLPGGRRYLP